MVNLINEVKASFSMYRKIYIDVIVLLCAIGITFIVILNIDFDEKLYQTFHQYKYFSLIVLFLSLVSLYLIIFVIRRFIDLKSLHFMAYSDSLIGIFNRRRGSELIYHQLNKRDNSQKVSIIMFDIDDFKSINDINGHNYGDYILKEIIEILQKSSRISDIFIRWGGDEFIILCLETKIEEAKELAERFRVVIEKHIFLNDISVTASFGVTSLVFGEDLSSLILRVDQNLYHSKKVGKNYVTVK